MQMIHCQLNTKIFIQTYVICMVTQIRSPLKSLMLTNKIWKNFSVLLNNIIVQSQVAIFGIALVFSMNSTRVTSILQKLKQ